MHSSSSPLRRLVAYANVPNLISITRLLVAPVVVGLAAKGHNLAFLGLALTLLLTDWVDGRIARAWNQQTTFGARLDAFCDVAIYACIAWSLWLLRPDEVWDERYLLIAVLASYVLSLTVSLAKFGCLPNYHTRLAKISWGLVTVGVVAMSLELSIWPMRIALAAVTAANIESMTVTAVLKQWRPDISSVTDALRRPEQAKCQGTRSSAT